MTDRPRADDAAPRTADRIPHVEQTMRRLASCPVEGCDESFDGATEEAVVDHIVVEHEASPHPHLDRDDVTAQEALYRFTQDVRGPVPQERPADELPPRLVAFFDRYLLVLLFVALLVGVGWPFLLTFLFG